MSKSPPIPQSSPGTLRVLRGYQLDAIRHALGELRGPLRMAAGIIGQAGGKTDIALGVGLGWTAGPCIIAAPLLTIQGNFDREAEGIAGYTVQSPPADLGFALPLLLNGRVRRTRKNVLRALRLFLQEGSAGPLLVTTHQALARMEFLALLPADLRGYLFIIDEAAHRGLTEGGEPVTRLAEVVAELHARGAAIYLMMGQDMRGDGYMVLPSEVARRAYRAPASVLAAHNCMPTKLRVSSVLTMARATKIEEVLGEVEEPGDVAGNRRAKRIVRALTKAYVACWLKGRPKVIFFVPTGVSRLMRDALLVELSIQAPGVRVHDATGTESGRAEALDNLLRSERAVKRYEASRVDVIIVCRRGNEGLDWPLCSVVYYPGIPASHATTIQVWARAFRYKGGIEGYPVEFADTAEIVFFGLHLSEGLRTEYLKRHGEYTLLLACYVESWDTAQAYGRAFRLEATAARVAGRSGPRAVPDLAHAHALLILTRARIQLGVGATYGDALWWYLGHRASVLPPEGVTQEEVETALGFYVNRSRLWASQRPARYHPDWVPPDTESPIPEVIQAEMKDLFQTALAGLDGLTLEESLDVQRVLKVSAELSCQTAGEVARRLSKAVGLGVYPFADLVAAGFNGDAVCRGYMGYRRANGGRAPGSTEESSSVHTGLHVPWRAIHEAFLSGPWVEAGAPVLNLEDAGTFWETHPQPVRKDRLMTAVRAYQAEHRCPPPGWPTDLNASLVLRQPRDAEVIRALKPGYMGAPLGENWIFLDLACRWGFRGFPGGQALNTWIEENA